MKKKRIFLALAILLLAGFGIRWGIAIFGGKGNGLTLYGNVDIRDVNLGFRVAGRLMELYRDEGDLVRAGDLLGRLDPGPYEREVREAQATVGALRARYSLLQAGYRKEDIAQARAIVQQRRAVLANAEQILRRRNRLSPTGAASVEANVEALASRDEAAASLKAAEESLRLLENGYRVEEIQEAKNNLEKAEAALSLSRLRLEDTELRSPADGVILTRANEPGAILAVGTTVFALTLTRNVWIRAYVGEEELGRVHPGDPVLIFTDSRPGQPYHGNVGFVSPTAEFTPKTVETPDLRTDLVYRLRIIVNDPDAALRQGMPVTVHFQPDVQKS